MPKKRHVSTIPLILSLVVVVLSGYCLWVYQRSRSVPPRVLLVAQESPTPAPAGAPLTQVSPDGTHTLTLVPDGERIAIRVNDQVVATRQRSADAPLALPFNAWSPNNAYFFIQEGTTYHVMTVTGKSFAEGLPDLPVSALFTKAYPDNTITAVTGWAAPTLLVVNATSAKETKMSFWLDVQTHKFIRLSNYFE